MKAGDIIFVEGTTLVSRLIQYFDDEGVYSHVAIAVSDTHIVEAQYGLNVIYREFPDEYKYYSVVDLHLTDEQRQEIRPKAFTLLDRKYDYFQIAGYLLKRIFKTKKNRLNSRRNLICSELVYTVLRDTDTLNELGIKTLEGSDITPNQLFDLVKHIGYVKYHQ